jgi:hypothetical protein
VEHRRRLAVGVPGSLPVDALVVTDVEHASLEGLD